MEVDERVVARRVLVAVARRLRVVARVQRGVTARRRLGRRVPHVLHVTLPGATHGRELIGDRGHESGVDAALSDRLTVGVEGRCAGEVGVDHAVPLRLGVRRLATHERDVVVEAHVTRRVVLPQQLSLLGELLGKVDAGRRGAEGLVEALVLEDDDEDVT